MLQNNPKFCHNCKKEQFPDVDGSNDNYNDGSDDEYDYKKVVARQSVCNSQQQVCERL